MSSCFTVKALYEIYSCKWIKVLKHLYELEYGRLAKISSERKHFLINIILIEVLQQFQFGL